MQKPPRHVFIPPGAGRRRVFPAKTEVVKAAGAAAVRAGWTLTKVVAGLGLLGAGAMAFSAAKGPVAAGVAGASTVEAARGALAAVGMLAAGLGYLLFYLWGLAWFVLALAGLVQGDAKGAILFFVGSPVLIVMAGALGWGVGHAAGLLLR